MAGLGQGPWRLDAVTVAIPLPQPQRRGVFVQRLNRFAVEVSLDGMPAVAHLPNSGRMRELLVPGHPVIVVEQPGAHRKTPYDLLLVQYRNQWVSVDARLPSALAAAALRAQALPEWADYTTVRREVAYHDSRLDIELTAPGGRRCLIETKSCNLVEEGIALFPDAPTTRGARHLHTLIHATQHGIAAAALFIIQRADARVLRPFDTADPAFGQALRQAAKAGVTVAAYGCCMTPDAMTLAAPVLVDLS